MADNKVSVGLEVDTASAIKSVDAFAKDTEKTLNKLSKDVNGIKFLEGFELALELGEKALHVFEVGLEGVIHVLEEAAGAAIKKEDAINKLNVALKLSGDFTKETSSRFQELSESIQGATGVDSDAVLNVLALGKAYGLTNDQAEKLAKTSVDLSAVTGQDLNTSADSLIKTFSGVTRGLDKVNPELKNLSTAALTSGAALDVLGKKFGGAAEGLTNTFGGAIRLAKSSFDELLVSLGRFITGNPVIIAGVKGLSKLFEEIKKVLDENRETIISLVNNGFIALLKVIPALIQGFGKLDEFISTINVGYTKLSGTVEAFIARVTGGSAEEIASINKRTAESVEKTNSGFEARKKIIDDVAQITEGYIKTVEKQASVSTKNLNNEIKLQNSATRAVEERVKANQELIAQEEKRKRDFAKSEVEKAAKGIVIQPSVTPENVNLSADEKKALEVQKAAGAALGVTSLALKGAAGAQQLVTQTISTFVDTVLPGFGAVVGEIINVLAQGPDKVRETVNAFVTQIPIIINNIILSIPVLVESLVLGIAGALDTIAQTLPETITKALDALVALLQNEKFIAALLGAVTKFQIALSAQAPSIAIAFQIAMVREAPKIALAIATGTVEAIKQQIAAAGNLFGGGGGGGIGGAISSVGKFLGFADGGEIPSGFPNDSGIIRAQSGERVLDRETNEAFKQLVRGGGAGGGTPVTVVLQIGEEQLARAMFNINRAGFRTS